MCLPQTILAYNNLIRSTTRKVSHMAIACPICGSANQEGTGRCHSCGAPLPIMDLPEIIAPDAPAPGASIGTAAPAGESTTPPLVDPPAERVDADGQGRVEQGPLRRTVFQEAPPPPMTPPPVPSPPPVAGFEPPPPELEVQPAVAAALKPPPPEPAAESTSATAQGKAGADRAEAPPAAGGAPGEQKPEPSPAGGAPTQEWAAVQQWPWAYQPYGMPGAAAMYPWMFPYPLTGYYSPAFGFLPCPYPPVYPQFAMPWYGAGPYGQVQYPVAAANQPAQQRERRAPGSGRKGLVITLLILLLLLVVGGAVAAYFLLTGESKKSFNLGDATAVGADVEFRDMVLRQDGDVLTLSGKYDNNTESKGDAVITVQAIGNGGTTRVAFTVAVETGTGKSFTEQSAAGPMKLSGATLGSIVFESREEYDSGDTNGESSAPWEVEQSVPEESVPLEEEQSVPYESAPGYEEFFEESIPGQTGSLFPSGTPGTSVI